LRQEEREAQPLKRPQVRIGEKPSFVVFLEAPSPKACQIAELTPLLLPPRSTANTMINRAHGKPENKKQPSSCKCGFPKPLNSVNEFAIPISRAFKKSSTPPSRQPTNPDQKKAHFYGFKPSYRWRFALQVILRAHEKHSSFRLTGLSVLPI
jgi:hypothetical protein